MIVYQIGFFKAQLEDSIEEIKHTTCIPLYPNAHYIYKSMFNIPSDYVTYTCPCGAFHSPWFVKALKILACARYLSPYYCRTRPRVVTLVDLMR